MKERHADTTTSSFGGPEDFTMNMLQNMKRNKSDLSLPSESSVDGPEDFTADIIEDLRRDKKAKSPARSRQPTVSDAEEDSRPISINLLGDDDLTAPLAESTKLEGRPSASNKLDNEMESLRHQLEQMRAILAQKDETIGELQAKLAQKDETIGDLQATLAQQDEKLAQKNEVLAQKNEILAQQDEMLVQRDEMLVEADEAFGVLQVQVSKNAEACKTIKILETEVKTLKTTAQAAKAEATRARKEQEERDTLWIERSDILLAEIDRRGKAVMWAIGEKECPGMVDEKGRQAYHYRNGKDYTRASTSRTKPSTRRDDTI